MLRKELLTMHPTSLLFLPLSALLLVPGYPYLVTFFYTGLAVFFTCLSGRENHDVFYALSLPVSRAGVVKARFAYAAALELAQWVLAIPFAFLRQQMPVPENPVGMEANLALLGLALGMMGVFNLVFLGRYYRDTARVEAAFVWAAGAVTVYMILVETSAHVVPFVRDRLDTPDPQFLGGKLAVLALGAAVYAGLTLGTMKRAIKSFEQLDL